LNRDGGVLRVNGAVTQNWIYKDGLAPAAETDGGTNIISFFVYGTSALSPDYMVREGVTYRLIRDFVGSVRLVVNAATGDIAQRLDYDSFGNIIADTNPGFQPFGFKSGLYDPDTGLVHFGARWYDPETGRWIAKDPILLAGGLNLYAFCGNYPVNFSDPWGLCESASEAGKAAGKKYAGFWQWNERGGLIYTTGGKFYYTPPAPSETSGHLYSCPGAAVPYVPEGASVVGTWHTHSVWLAEFWTISNSDFVAANAAHAEGVNYNIMINGFGVTFEYGFDGNGNFWGPQ